MDAPRFHLAQVNIGVIREPLEHPSMAGFVDNLERINALAERSPGFVWRLQTDEGDATAFRVFDDSRLLINMSLWTSVEALHGYVYRSEHVDFLRERKAWFVPMNDRPHQVLWWLPAGTLPTVDDAKARLERLAAEGPIPEAFSFSRRFPPPGSTGPD